MDAPSLPLPCDLLRIGLPRIGLGTWQMEDDDQDAAVTALQRGLELGMRHVDTAEMYGSGGVERLVARAIAGRRDSAFIVSKVLPSNASFRGTIRACERSLQRLGIEQLDMYLLHWPGSHAIEETIRAFDKLVADGKIARWGVSNFDVRELAAAFAIAGPGKIASNQVLYHLGERAIEHDVLPWCRQHNVPVVAYSPFGSGQFPAPRSRGRNVLDEIAEAHGATAHQIALAFLVRDPLVWAIPKSAQARNVEDNHGAEKLRLSRHELAAIDAAFPSVRTSHLPVI